MPITVTEIGPQREGAIELRVAPGLDGNPVASTARTYTRLFRAITTASAIGAQAVIQAVGIAVGDPYNNGLEADAESYCSRLYALCQPDDDSLTWIVRVEYGPLDTTYENQNPLDDPYDVDWGGEPYEEVIEEDESATPKPILNSAKDPFDPPLTRQRNRSVLVVERNEASYDEELAYRFSDTVNSDTFFNAPAGNCKCGKITGKRMYSQYLEELYGKGLGYYWRVRYEFHFNPEGWARKILDAGYRCLTGSPSARTNILIGGIPATSPVPLDGAGNVLSPSGTPQFLTFNMYKSADFSAFGFDDQSGT